jgi:hypothetical protein
MRYRYLTAALAGEWRDSPAEACADAIRLCQADRRDDGSIKWRGSARLQTNAGRHVKGGRAA